jgi:hypothetical protein
VRQVESLAAVPQLGHFEGLQGQTERAGGSTACPGVRAGRDTTGVTTESVVEVIVERVEEAEGATEAEGEAVD